jgi:hypothetical protein
VLRALFAVSATFIFAHHEAVVATCISVAMRGAHGRAGRARGSPEQQHGWEEGKFGPKRHALHIDDREEGKTGARDSEKASGVSISSPLRCVI